MAKFFPDHAEYPSFLESKVDPYVQKALEAIELEIISSEKFSFVKKLVLLGSFRSGNWALRTIRRSEDNSDIDLVPIVELEPTDDQIDQKIDELDSYVAARLRNFGLNLCHLIRPGRSYLNLNNLSRHFATLQEEAEEFLNTEGSFEIEKIAAVAAAVSEPMFRNQILDELKKYFSSDPAGLEQIKDAINLFLDVMFSARFKHLTEKSDYHSKEQIELIQRTARRINALKSKVGKRSVENL